MTADPTFDALVVTRWLHFAALIALFGGAVFWCVVVPECPAVSGDGLAATRRRSRSLARVFAVVGALAGLGWLVGSVAFMTGGFANAADPETWHAFFFETAFGPLWALRLGLLAVGVMIAFSRVRPQLRFAALLVVAGALLVSQSWLGHAAEGGASLRGMAMIGAYAVHVLAAGAWVGGLLPLFLAIVELRSSDSSRAATLRLLSRYSTMAFAAVTLVLLAGVANTGFRVGTDVRSFLGSDYGHVLLAKLGLVGLMLGLAGFNRFIAMPRLASSALTFSLGAELIVGVLVLGAAAVLGITAPPH